MYSLGKQPFRFNYSLVMRTLLPLICGTLRYHANMINAAAGCREFSADDSRYIAMNGTKNSTYLSNMKLGQRNAPVAMQLLFCTGEYEEEFYDKPTADLFSDIVSEHLKFKHDDDELVFREAIMKALVDGDNSHMKENDVNKLLNSVKNDEIKVLIFNCIYTAIMCGGNTANRKVYKTELDELEADTIRTVDNMTEEKKTVYRCQISEAEDI